MTRLAQENAERERLAWECKLFRKTYKFTQEDIANAAGVGRGVVSDLEIGKKLTRKTNMQKIRDAIRQLRDGNGDMTQDERIVMGEHIRKLREQHGLSQTEVADIAGISQPNMTILEKGTYVNPDTMTDRIDIILRHFRQLKRAEPPTVAWPRTEFLDLLAAQSTGEIQTDNIAEEEPQTPEPVTSEIAESTDGEDVVKFLALMIDKLSDETLADARRHFETAAANQGESEFACNLAAAFIYREQKRRASK